MWKAIISILTFKWVKKTFPDKVPYLIIGAIILAILVILSDLWERVKTDKIDSNISLKYPRLYMITLIVTTIISFIFCIDVKNYLEGLILSSIVETLIVMILFPLVVAAIILKSKIGFLQVLGGFFAGIALGAMVRITLIFAGIFLPIVKPC
jgi:hypothetical protein